MCRLCNIPKNGCAGLRLKKHSAPGDQIVLARDDQGNYSLVYDDCVEFEVNFCPECGAKLNGGETP